MTKYDFLRAKYFAHFAHTGVDEVNSKINLILDNKNIQWRLVMSSVWGWGAKFSKDSALHNDRDPTKKESK